ncbi:hypothetical protein [Cryobacterium sp. Y82]|uniref:hypothetical protein n=1 Tax=Cryobacterium sp. Y82 TaxID=2045017 RepID=UPI000CE4D23C|nr:hypothetical protein [Cryobacterium sp. Y82]
MPTRGRATDSCAKRFHPIFEVLTDPHVLILMSLPVCYRCHQMTRNGSIMRFERGNPACNEPTYLLSAKSAQANKTAACHGSPAGAPHARAFRTPG